MSVWKSDEKLLSFASLQDNVKMRRQIRFCVNQVIFSCWKSWIHLVTTYIVSGCEASEAPRRSQSQEANKAWSELGYRERNYWKKSKQINRFNRAMQGLENILYSTYRHNTRGLSGFSVLKIRYGKRMKTELKTTCF